MANLDISSKLSKETQEITIAPGQTYEVDCGAETMLKAQDLFNKDNSLEGLFEAIKLLLGKKALDDIKKMKVTVKDLRTILIAIMAQVNEVSYEEMEKRFQQQ